MFGVFMYYGSVAVSVKKEVKWISFDLVDKR